VAYETLPKHPFLHVCKPYFWESGHMHFIKIGLKGIYAVCHLRILVSYAQELASTRADVQGLAKAGAVKRQTMALGSHSA
jgi:hypothetical protein